MDLKNKLQKLIDNKGVTAYEVGLKAEIAHSSMSRILSGETDKLSTKNKTKLAKYFNINEDYFNNGNETEIEGKPVNENSAMLSMAKELLEMPFFRNGIKELQKEISTDELRAEIEKMIRKAEKEKSKQK